MEPGFHLSIVRWVVGEEQQLIVFSNSLDIAIFFSNKHTSVVAKLDGHCTTVIFIIVNTGVIAAKINTDNRCSLNVKGCSVLNNLRAEDKEACMNILACIFDGGRQSCKRLVSRNDVVFW